MLDGFRADQWGIGNDAIARDHLQLGGAEYRPTTPATHHPFNVAYTNLEHIRAARMSHNKLSE